MTKGIVLMMRNLYQRIRVRELDNGLSQGAIESFFAGTDREDFRVN